jgi:hypothetical protein
MSSPLKNNDAELAPREEPSSGEVEQLGLFDRPPEVAAHRLTR